MYLLFLAAFAIPEEVGLFLLSPIEVFGRGEVAGLRVLDELDGLGLRGERSGEGSGRSGFKEVVGP